MVGRGPRLLNAGYLAESLDEFRLKVLTPVAVMDRGETVMYDKGIEKYSRRRPRRLISRRNRLRIARKMVSDYENIFETSL